MFGNKTIRLSKEQKDTILKLHRRGITVRALAISYSMSIRQIRRIVTYEPRWRGPK